MEVYVSFAALIVSIITFILTITWQMKYNSKQKILDKIYDDLYIVFPKKIDNLLRKNDITQEDVQSLKSYIFNTIIPCFSCIKYRNEKKYLEIKDLLQKIEDNACNLIQGFDSIGYRNQVKINMNKLYKTIDKYLHFSK